jgi:hypothetical protein
MQIAVLALLLVVAKATANDDDWCAVGPFDHNMANENEDGTTTTCMAISSALGTRYSAGDLAACDGDYAGYFAYIDLWGCCPAGHNICSDGDNHHPEACREFGYPDEGKWQHDEDCCALENSGQCADGFTKQQEITDEWRCGGDDHDDHDDECSPFKYRCVPCGEDDAGNRPNDCYGSTDDKPECQCDCWWEVVIIIIIVVACCCFCMCVIAAGCVFYAGARAGRTAPPPQQYPGAPMALEGGGVQMMQYGQAQHTVVRDATVAPHTNTNFKGGDQIVFA